jgi:hypothetical protein
MADYSLALGVKPLQLEDPLTAYGRFATIQNAQNQNALAQYQLSAAQREDAATNALNAAYKDAYNTETGDIDLNKLRKSLSTGGFGAKLPALEKSFSELKTQKLTQSKTETELIDSKLKQQRSFLDTIDPNDPNAPQQFIAWHEANHRDPVLGPLLASRGITADQARGRIDQAIRQGPQAFAQLLMQSKLGTEEFIKQNAPKFFSQDTGGQTQLVSVPGLGGPATTVTGSTATKTLTPGETAQQSRPVSVAANATLVNPISGAEIFKGAPAPSSIAAMQAEADALPAGDPRRDQLEQKIKKETQNTPHFVSSAQGVMAVDPQTNKATPVLVNGRPLLDSSTELGQAQLKIAKQRLNLSEQTERRLQEEADSSGGLSPQALDIAAQMVVQSGVMPPLGSGKNASAARLQVMNRVAEMTGTDAAAGASSIIGNQQNTLAAKAALKDFTSGISSRRVVANNTAINHLETMDKLAADLNNRDTRIFNAAGNAFATATGQTAPTSFDAAKQLVAAEVIKAVVSNGGGVTERQEAAQNFSRANSPQQLREVINTYRELLGGQLQSLEGQYKAGTGRDDFRTKFLTTNTQKVLPAAPAAAKPAVAASKAPAGVPQDVWGVMTPDERKLWQK